MTATTAEGDSWTEAEHGLHDLLEQLLADAAIDDPATGVLAALEGQPSAAPIRERLRSGSKRQQTAAELTGTAAGGDYTERNGPPEDGQLVMTPAPTT